MSSNKKTARLAGWLYLVYLVTQIVSDAFIRQRLIVWGDASANANKITANEALFRAGFVGDVLAAVLFLLAAWALYGLLRPVHHNAALAMLLLNLGGVAIQAMNALNLIAALLLAKGGGTLAVLDEVQLQTLALFYIDLHKNGFMVAQVFYGTWLLPLGYLVYKSRFLPRFLGILLVLDSFGVLIWFFQFFLLPGYEAITYPGLAASFLAELSLTFWLLIKGVSQQKPGPVGAG